MFSNRLGLLTAVFAAYLAVCVAVLVVRGYMYGRSMRALRKQMRIIEAISATFDTTFLLHLETLRMEPIHMSEAVTRVFSAHSEAHDFLDHVCRDLIAPEFRETVTELMDVKTLGQRMAGNAFIGADVKVADGTWYSLQVMPQLRDNQGKLQAVLVASRNVTAMKQAEELSYRDKLTGLRNRNYLESRGEEFMRTGDLPVSVVMADCNYLKRTNDTRGHEWGDKLLARVPTACGYKAPFAPHAAEFVCVFPACALAGASEYTFPKT